jgi:hypothetical protein
MALPINRPGYAQIDAVSRLALDAEAWGSFLRDILRMPFPMLAAVQHAVRTRNWRRAKNPLESVRTCADNWELRRIRSKGARREELVNRMPKTITPFVDGRERAGE